MPAFKTVHLCHKSCIFAPTLLQLLWQFRTTRACLYWCFLDNREIIEKMDPLFRLATIHDLAQLSVLNKQLREDEKIDNKMTDEEITQRMEFFITGQVYKVHVLENQEKEIIGYCVLDITRNPYYLRQLFVKSIFRNNGYGKLLLEKVMAEYRLKEIDLEVIQWNESAIRFYEHVGFKRRYIGMRLTTV
jgi:ribosomal protein S18 acetylase RimI-like enzyme